MSTSTGAQLLVRMLKAEGVRHIFTLSGLHVAPIYAACVEEGIQLVDTRHEQAAAHAADATARLVRGVRRRVDRHGGGRPAVETDALFLEHAAASPSRASDVAAIRRALETPVTRREFEALPEAAGIAIDEPAIEPTAQAICRAHLDATVAGVEQRRGNVSQAWSWLGSYDLARDAAARLFGPAGITVMPKRIEQTPDQLNAVLRTLSFYARLSPEQRQALEHEYQALYERLGRPIRASTVAALVTAVRR